MSAFLPEFSPLFTQVSILCLIVGEVFLGAVIIFLLIRQRRLKAKMNIFFSGKDAKDLEKVLVEQLTEIRALDQEIQELFEISNRLRELSLKGLHKAAVIRFNPFKEVGGNQSFSVVLLDGKNSGVLLSSLHTREGTRMYAKPVLAGGQNGFPFTEEEKAAIAQAMSGKPSVV